MIERFELPRELLSRLPILSEYLHNRDQTLANGFTYQQLLDEMDSAIGAIDSRQPSSAGYSGQCWVHPQAKIDENVVMEGPCIVCRGAVVGPKAYLGPGTVVGPEALLSFGVKVKATVVGAKSKIRHRTFVANSIIGESTDITETLIVSSTQNDHSPVKSWTMTGRPLQTNLTQLGSHIGTRAKLGANTLVMPGSVLCDDISVGNTVVNGYVTSHSDSQPWDSRLEAIKSLVRSLYRQHDLFWQQSQLFLTLSGFLFAAVVFMSSINAPSDSATGIGFLAFGLIVSLSWLQVCRAARDESRSLDATVKQKLATDEEMNTWLGSEFAKRQESGAWRTNALSAMQIIASLSALLWLSLGTWAIVDVVRGGSDSGAPPPTAQRPAQADILSSPRVVPDAGMPVGPASPNTEPAQPAQLPQVLPTDPGFPGFTVQVAALENRFRAAVLGMMLLEEGYPAYVAETEIPGLGTFYRVRIGPLSTVDEATELGTLIENRFAGYLSEVWIVPPDRTPSPAPEANR